MNKLVKHYWLPHSAVTWILYDFNQTNAAKQLHLKGKNSAQVE